MEKIKVKICQGITSYVTGGQRCLGYCNKCASFSKAPYVYC